MLLRQAPINPPPLRFVVAVVLSRMVQLKSSRRKATPSSLFKLKILKYSSVALVVLYSFFRLSQKSNTTPISSVRKAVSSDGANKYPYIGATYDEDGEPLSSTSSSDLLPNVVFTPDNVLNGKLDRYVSLPVFDDNVTYENIQERVQKSIARKVDLPFGLMHQGMPPGKDAVMGLATYGDDDVEVFRKLVGSLRTSGFDGHIILGVTPSIKDNVKSYLMKMDVTFYGIEKVTCDKSITDGEDGTNVRNTCAKGTDNLTIEKGRFEMSRQWLHACKECTGWVLLMDTRDIFFQQPPFTGMPPPDKSPYDLLLIEEIAPHSLPKRDNPRTGVTKLSDGWYQGSDGGCYGHNFHNKYQDRAILCSGTIIGNRRGIDRFIAVFVDEFLENYKKPNQICKGSETPDQLILQPMYYSGYFGDVERTRTSPWGTGPVNTIGVPCVRSGVHSSLDLTDFDKDSGFILNPNLKDGHPMRVAPIVHQYDRCHGWIHDYFQKYDKELFGGPVDQQNPVSWKVKSA